MSGRTTTLIVIVGAFVAPTLAFLAFAVLVTAIVSDATAETCSGSLELPPPDASTAVSAGRMGAFALPRPDPGNRSAAGHAGAIPVDYLAAYKAAAARYGVPWQLLAGIGWAETRHGMSNAAGVHSGSNFAGAMGPMQFTRSTWASYGVDVDGSGANVYDIRDAAAGAARYVVVRPGVKDGPAGVRNAILRYDHSTGYMNDVLTYAWDYANGKVVVVPASDSSAQCTPDGGAQPKGLERFDGHLVSSWIVQLLKQARQVGWTGHVTSGYRSAAEQRRICSSPPYPRPCAAAGHSHHQGINYPGGAVDVSDPNGLVSALKKVPGGEQLQHAPHGEDPPHFSHHYGGGY